MNRYDEDPNSFLLADCGSAYTTVALFDRVGKGFRLVARGKAPTTIGRPWQDIALGIQWATEQITQTTGRSLLTDEGDLITPGQTGGSGVDFFAMTISAARPLKVLVAGLLEDVSVASARRALQSIYTHEVNYLTIDATIDDQRVIKAILDGQPELIFMTGGADGSEPHHMLPLLRSLELSAGLLHGTRYPDILYAGNNRFRERVTNTFSSLSTVHICENVRPSIDVEQLGSARQSLVEILYERKISNLPGIDNLASWANPVIQTTAQSFATMIDYFASLHRSRVLGIDLGSSHVTLASSVWEQESHLYVDSKLGLGEPLVQLLERLEPEEILQWVPVNLDAKELQDFVGNRGLYPHTVAATEDEIYLEQALARFLLKKALERASHSWEWDRKPFARPMPDVLVLRGGILGSAPRPARAVLTVLDSLQPAGVFSLVVDRYDVLPMLGLLATREPAATVQILEGGALLELGWAIAPVGSGPKGQRALRIVVESEDKGQYRIDADFGELIAVPLPSGTSADITLKPERKVDIGRGPGKGRKLTIHGGEVGLIVDMRGRPLRLPEDDQERHELVQQWHWDMGG